MNKEEVLFKEYDTLRAEILTAMTNRNTILTFGLATIGVLYTGAAALTRSSDYSNLTVLILTLIAPLICTFISMIWLGEYERMRRASKFLINVERRINEMVGDRVLTWETSLYENKKHMKYPYNSIIMFLTVLSMFSYTIGLYLFDGSRPLKITLSILGLGIIIGFCFRMFKKLKKCLDL